MTLLRQIILAIMLIFLLVYYINDSFGQNIIKLEQGQEAPFTGALVPNERMNDFRKTDEENKLLKKEIITFKELGVIYEARIELRKELAEEYKKDYTKSEAKRSVTNLGHFLLGVAVTVFAFKVAQEVYE